MEDPKIHLATIAKHAHAVNRIQWAPLVVDLLVQTGNEARAQN
jgi:hypothetical protein